ncbi:endoplasmic reticulum transmembrane protein 1 [Diutina rugosa]
MSLQMSIVFATLLTQMAFLLLLVTPLPFAIRTKIVDFTFFLQKNKHYRTFVAFFVVLMSLQVADCVQKLQRFQKTNNPYFAQDANKPLSYDQLASKFYAQRNLYISGAVLYLTIAIYTVVTIVRKLVVKEKAIRMVESGEIESPTAADDSAKLMAQIEKRNKEIEALSAQVNNLQREYDGLSTSQPVAKDD